MQLTQKFAAYIAGRRLHWMILLGILHAPICFFDTTPLGRIINRFSKDIDAIDASLPNAFSQALTVFVTVLATLIILIYGSWFAIIEFVPLAILFIYIQVEVFHNNMLYYMLSFISVFICHHLVNCAVLIQ